MENVNKKIMSLMNRNIMLYLFFHKKLGGNYSSPQTKRIYGIISKFIIKPIKHLFINNIQNFQKYYITLKNINIADHGLVFFVGFFED